MLAVIVVLVAGLSTPQFVWDNNVDVLAQAGYRVLTFDHFGRGYSDRPDVIYDREHYNRELLELLNALGLKQPVILVGYSMGGGNVICFSATYPKRVKKLILIAPAGYIPEYSGLASLVLLPVLGDWLMTMLGKDAMLEEIRKDVAAGNGTPNMVQKFEERFQYKGYLPAILSTMRNYPMYDLSKDYEKVGTLGIPTYAIWGTEDKTVPYSGVQKVKGAIPQSEMFIITGGRHSITYANAVKINELILNIIKQ